jgi:Na+/phosphate symporter
LPGKLRNTISSQFAPFSYSPANENDPPAFDKVRASVNLVVASILIAIGTSLKLPLSTTYVTFMVAMGTSLADRAWGRESAVYRISGVFAVIGGWFLTALIAFTVSAFIATIIALGGNFMIFVFVATAIFMVIRTYMMFQKRSKEKSKEDDEIFNEKDGVEKVLQKSKKQLLKSIESIVQIYSVSVTAFAKESLSSVKKGRKLKDELNKKAKKQKNKVVEVLAKIDDHEDSGHFYVQMVDYLREMAHSMNFIVDPLFNHLDNHHKPFNKEQSAELKNIVKLLDGLIDDAKEIINNNDFEKLEKLIGQRDAFVEDLNKFEKAQIKRIKAKEVNTRNSILFFNTLTETKNLLLHFINATKAYRDFVQETNDQENNTN